MSKRRRRRKQRNRENPAPETGPKGQGGTATTDPEPPGRQRAPLVGWRQRVRGLLDGVRGYARTRHGEALDALLGQAFGDPPTPQHPADAERLVDDFVCTPGSADDGRSIARAFGEDAPGLDPEERAQVARWERERRRGVFLVQRCFTDKLELWDPLEGAGLTLALLDRLPPGRAAEVRRGAVATTTFLPYVARLIAVGLVEMYAESDAGRMFRDQVRESGAAWHDAPPPAPTPSA